MYLLAIIAAAWGLPINGESSTQPCQADLNRRSPMSMLPCVAIAALINTAHPLMVPQPNPAVFVSTIPSSVKLRDKEKKSILQLNKDPFFKLISQNSDSTFIKPTNSQDRAEEATIMELEDLKSTESTIMELKDLKSTTSTDSEGEAEEHKINELTDFKSDDGKPIRVTTSESNDEMLTSFQTAHTDNFSKKLSFVDDRLMRDKTRKAMLQWNKKSFFQPISPDPKVPKSISLESKDSESKNIDHSFNEFSNFDSDVSEFGLTMTQETRIWRMYNNYIQHLSPLQAKRMTAKKFLLSSSSELKAATINAFLNSRISVQRLKGNIDGFYTTLDSNTALNKQDSLNSKKKSAAKSSKVFADLKDLRILRDNKSDWNDWTHSV